MKLRKWREQKGLTLKQMATMVGCDESYLSLLERGKRTPSIKMMIKIFDVLGVPPDPKIFISNVTKSNGGGERNAG